VAAADHEGEVDRERQAVALPPELREMLRALAKDKLPDAFLFVQGNGEPMSRYTARDRVKAVLKRAGDLLPPQALRRTFTDLASMQATRYGRSARWSATRVRRSRRAATRRRKLSTVPARSGRFSDQRRKTMRIMSTVRNYERDKADRKEATAPCRRSLSSTTPPN